MSNDVEAPPDNYFELIRDFLTQIEFAQIADFMQIMTAVVALLIAYIVYEHGKTRDRENIVERSWNAQQELNIATLENSKIQKAYDCLVSGEMSEDNEVNHQVIFICFMLLNRIQIIWNGHNSKLFKIDELEKQSIPTLALASGNEEVLKYCLTRGYSSEYIEFILSMLPKAKERRKNIKLVDANTFLNKLKPID